MHSGAGPLRLLPQPPAAPGPRRGGHQPGNQPDGGGWRRRRRRCGPCSGTRRVVWRRCLTAALRGVRRGRGPGGAEACWEWVWGWRRWRRRWGQWDSGGGARRRHWGWVREAGGGVEARGEGGPVCCRGRALAQVLVARDGAHPRQSTSAAAAAACTHHLLGAHIGTHASPLLTPPVLPRCWTPALRNPLQLYRPTRLCQACTLPGAQSLVYSVSCVNVNAHLLPTADNWRLLAPDT